VTGPGRRRPLAGRPATGPAAGRAPRGQPRRPARCGGCAPEPPL